MTTLREQSRLSLSCNVIPPSPHPPISPSPISHPSIPHMPLPDYCTNFTYLLTSAVWHPSPLPQCVTIVPTMENVPLQHCIGYGHTYTIPYVNSNVTITI